MNLRPLALACVLLPACTIPGGAPFDRKPRAQEPEQIAPAGKTVRPQGPTIAQGTLARIEAENLHGSIRIIVDPDLTSPAVTARPWVPGGLDRRFIQGLEDNMEIDAKTTIENNQMVLHVVAPYPQWLDDLRVDLLIRTPDARTVIVNNAHGVVELVGVGGQIMVTSGQGDESAGGDILIRTDQPIEGPVHLATSNGDILVFMPGKSAGSLELTSDDGRVFVNIENAKIINARPEDAFYTGLLNDGVNTFDARTNHGVVSLNVEDADWEDPGPFNYRKSSRDR